MILRSSALAIFLAVGAKPAGIPTCQEKLDTAKIESLTGLKGVWSEEEGVFKVSAPRTDVKIAVDGWEIPLFMGLTSWAAFQKGKDRPAMVMGDLVLLQDEVNPVMSALLGAGISVTALHNHFLYDEPKVMFMHLEGEGTVDALGAGVRSALDKVKEIRAASPRVRSGTGSAALPDKSSIAPGPLEAVLGVKGSSKDGMFKAVFARTTRASCGCEVGKEMGVNTWAAFAGSDDHAVVDGDFAVLEAELQGVLKALRSATIEVVAIHSHMTGETPRILFLHYWGRGKSLDLAKGVKSALDTQGR